jgi:hypothetical protein
LKRKEIIAKEQNGAAGALEKCRALPAEVREKAPEGLDTNALAEFLVALQRAASVVWTVPQARLQPIGRTPSLLA